MKVCEAADGDISRDITGPGRKGQPGGGHFALHQERPGSLCVGSTAAGRSEACATCVQHMLGTH